MFRSVQVHLLILIPDTGSPESWSQKTLDNPFYQVIIFSGIHVIRQQRIVDGLYLIQKRLYTIMANLH